MADLLDVPIMFIDPVYATVTSKPSNEDMSSKEWIDNSGMTGGIIKFLSQGTTQKRTNISYFVKMAQDTSPDMIANYMDKAWKLRTPNIILSVISSPYHWKKCMSQGQREDFQAGIIQAVNTTSMWLLTDGANGGISRLIGDAIKMEKERRHLLATNFSSKFITTSKLQKLPKITAIGVVPTLQLSCADDFDREEGEITIELDKQVNMSETVELNPDLTNFVMLDQIETHKETFIERLKLEKRFQSPVGKPRLFGKICDINQDSAEGKKLISCTTTPLVGLLVQGSPCDIDHVCDLIKMKVPVIVVKGTGAAADLFSFVYESVKQRPEEEHVNAYIRPELLKRIQKVYPKEFNNDVLARNRCRDMIIDCVQFSRKVQQNFITILDIEGDPSGLQNLDKYILLAMFESQEPVKGGLFQQQILGDLKLTLDWNRSDLALSQIFQKYEWTNIKLSKDLFDLAMVKKDRHKFVELFLDKQAIDLHKYFNFGKLLYLINNHEDSEFFRTICLGECLGYSPNSDYPVNKRFVYGYRSGFNTLLYKTTHLWSLVSSTDFGIEEVEMDEVAASIAERKAINILVYWAALNYDPALTKTLWKKTEEPMAMAIMVGMIWHSIGKQWCPDSDTKRKLLASAKEFYKMAVDLLEYSYQDSAVNTIALMDKRLVDFDNRTVIELAHMAKNKYFIAHNACQKWLDRRWFGNLLIRKLDWGPSKIPNWLKIYMSLVMVFPMFIWITYDLADKERRDKIIEDELDDNLPKDEPEPMHQPSVRVNKWLINPTETIAYRMKSVWNYGKERFKVPIHLQFYYLWSAPITKFWLNQMFYIVFLVLFSLATLHPNCGMIYLDLGVFVWVLMIWVELVRSTISKWRKYKELDLFWTVVEIFVMMFLLMVILTVRITPYFVAYFDYMTTKFVMSLGLLYFYYRVVIVFLPISSILGPMLISIKRMITHDFLTWFRMFLIIMVSGAVTIHSVLYPNYPVIAEGIKKALSRAFFAMFLTKIDDLDGDTCSVYYKNESLSRCYSLPVRSFYSDFNHLHNETIEEDDYRRLAKCPYSSIGGYLMTIQYLLIVKLILVTLLYALFSSTNARVKEESEAIWKFQKYSLIIDFEEKLILPPPLNFLSYIVMFFQLIVYLIKHCYRKCKGCSQCCKKNKHALDRAKMMSIRLVQRVENYSYWKTFVRKLQFEEEKEKAEKDRSKTQSQILETLLNKFTDQQVFGDRLTEQVSNLEQNVTNCQVALEKIQHTIEKLNPHLQPTIDSNTRFIHVLSRQSPYPSSNVQRFPVMDKYVPWETPYSAYDPAIYSSPVKYFSEDTRPYVDIDYLQLIKESQSVSVSRDDVRDIGSELGNTMPVWNTSSKITLNGQEVVINRTSFITQNKKPVKYALDTCNLPINPKGRTGLRGRGRLLRWGPNHSAMVVITRWKKKENTDEFMEVDGKKLLEVVAIQRDGFLEPDLPRGGDYGHMTIYSAVCKKFLTYAVESDTTKKINPDMNEEDMIKFFKQLLLQQEQQKAFSSSMIYRGYLDDPSNTDNAWKEVEVWNFHFDQGGQEIDSKLKDKEKRWKTVSSYNTFHGSQNLILRQAATRHSSYY